MFELGNLDFRVSEKIDEFFWTRMDFLFVFLKDFCVNIFLCPITLKKYCFFQRALPGANLVQAVFFFIFFLCLSFVC